MKFTSREHVEATGRSRVRSEVDGAISRGFNLGRFWIYVDPQDHGYSKHALNDGYWEAWITYWMSNNVEPGSYCLDIGANHGYYSMFLADHGCRVTAIEPQPKLCRLIQKSAWANGFDVDVVCAAVSAEEGEVEMTVPIHHGMNATISSQNSYAPDGENKITVKTLPLDNYTDAGVDFVKIDVEGAEELLWAGSKKFRNLNPNCLILMEWRWDRLENPVYFAQQILSQYTVTHVNYDGSESPLDSVEAFAARQHEDWMLVLRAS